MDRHTQRCTNCRAERLVTVGLMVNDEHYACRLCQWCSHLHQCPRCNRRLPDVCFDEDKLQCWVLYSFLLSFFFWVVSFTVVFLEIANVCSNVLGVSGKENQDL